MDGTRAPACSVDFVLLDGFSLGSYAQAAETFAIANELGASPPYRLRRLGLTASPVRARCGTRVAIGHLAGEALGRDLVFLCAGEASTGLAPQQLLDWLRRCARFGATLAGLDAGVWLLARAGLTQGLAPHVPPPLAAAFTETFGGRAIAGYGWSLGERIASASGGGASAALAAALIARRSSKRLADLVVRQQGLPGRAAEPPAAPPSLSQRLGIAHPGLARCLDTMEAHLEEPLDKERLSTAAGLSTRQIERLFLRHFDQTPGAFYRTLRLARARRLLEHTTLSITEIAVATGFTSPSHFSRQFRATFGQRPTALRRGRARPLAPGQVARIA